MEASGRSSARRRWPPTRSGSGDRGRSRSSRSSARRTAWRPASSPRSTSCAGLGVLTGMDVVEVEGATGWYDTNYEGKRDAALAELAAGKDLFVIHVEATDEAGHAGDLGEKIGALEHWDAASSRVWWRGSTPWGRGGSCCCPTTPRRWR